MAQRRTEIQVGIAVLAALVVLVWGVTWLSDARLAKRRQTYHARFSDVGGLAEGDPIKVNGVQKGVVGGIALVPGGVVVDLSLDRDVPLTRDARVYVRNVGLMGEKFIAVALAPTGPRRATRDTIDGVYESGVPEVISQMGSALTSLQRVSDQIDRVLALAEERGSWKTTLANVEDASIGLAEAVRENREDVGAITDNLREMSSELRMLVIEKRPVVASSVDRIEATSQRVDSLVVRLDDLTRRFARVSDHLESDSTTVGRLLTERELYDDLRRTLRETSQLVRDVRANPRRYFNFSLF
jgi:phospholipid/cholesterol/gamma-HCH transport system substrate-binding protein